MTRQRTAVDYIPFPDHLWHISPKRNRNSILEKGLLGNNDGNWCVYLSHRPDSWQGLFNDWDLYKVLTRHLNRSDFTSVDVNIDETLYWGKVNGKILIPRSEITLVSSN